MADVKERIEYADSAHLSAGEREKVHFTRKLVDPAKRFMESESGTSQTSMPDSVKADRPFGGDLSLSHATSRRKANTLNGLATPRAKRRRTSPPPPDSPLPVAASSPSPLLGRDPCQGFIKLTKLPLTRSGNLPSSRKQLVHLFSSPPPSCTASCSYCWSHKEEGWRIRGYRRTSTPK